MKAAPPAAVLTGGPAEVGGSVPLRSVAATGVNVHGVLALPAPGNVSVLLTAHYDGVGDDPDLRLPAAADNASGVVPLRAGAVASDNRRYAAAGLPAIGLGMGVPGYHTPADTPDRVDPTTLQVATRLLVTAIRTLANP